MIQKKKKYEDKNEGAPPIGSAQAVAKTPDTHSLPATCPSIHLTSYSPFHQSISSRFASPYGSTQVIKDAPVTHTFGCQFL